jgi:hypothetical protein
MLATRSPYYPCLEESQAPAGKPVKQMRVWTKTDMQAVSQPDYSA